LKAARRVNLGQVFGENDRRRTFWLHSRYCKWAGSQGNGLNAIAQANRFCMVSSNPGGDLAESDQSLSENYSR
jgi:hypothetical protein